MNEWRILTRLELLSLFGINKLRHTRDPGEKKRGRLLLGVWVFLIVMIAGYMAGLVFLLTTLGLSSAVPLYLCTLSSLAVFLFGVFKAGNTLFGQSGYDLLASMPLRPRVVLLSRFTVLYVEEGLFSLALLLPGLVTYAVLCRPSVIFYPVAAVACLLLPLIPLVASVVFGTLVTWLSARMKHKSLVQSAFLVILVVGVSFASLRMGGVSEDTAEDLLTVVLRQATTLFASLYPPAAWLAESMRGGSLIGLGAFALLSLGATALCLLLAARLFSRIKRGLSSVRARHDYRLGAMQSRTLLRALYGRELRRYFASPVYVSNTIIGPILGVVLSVALLIMGVDTMESSVPSSVPVRTLLPYALAAVMCLMTPAAVSVSMEGKQMDTVKSLPIPVGVWLDSKILLSLTFLLPAYLISEILLTVVLRPTPLALIAQWLAPLSIILFSVVFGLTFNLAFHSFDWEREEMPVKQSLAALGGFAGPLAALLTGGMVAPIPSPYGDVVAIVVACVWPVIAGILYRRNRRVRMELL